VNITPRPSVALFSAGALAVLAGRLLLLGLVRMKLRRDVERLNAGDHRPILAAYAPDAVLAFDDGPHRWSGRHVGTAKIERFLSEIMRAGLQGHIREAWLSGPPWAATLIVRFDDAATGGDGEVLYANRVVIVARTRWGRIVEQEDFYVDTRRIDVFESQLRARGVAPLKEGPA
jgi:ketosteroid isomerase-like protein